MTYGRICFLILINFFFFPVYSQDDCSDENLAQFVNLIQSSRFPTSKRISNETIRDYAMDLGLRDQKSDSIIDRWLNSNKQFKNAGAFTSWFEVLKNELIISAKALRISIDSNRYHIFDHPRSAVNAVTLEVPNCKSHKVILFNQHLTLFLYGLPREISEIFDFRLIEYKPGYVTALAPSSYDLQDPTKFDGYYDFTLWLLGADQQGVSNATDSQLFFAFSITKGLEAFSISHELAHVFKNHLNDRKVLKLVTERESSDEPKTVKAFLYSWADELEADYFGTTLYSSNLTRVNDQTLDVVQLAKWCPAILMTSLEFYSRLMNISNDTTAWSIEAPNFRPLLKSFPENPKHSDFVNFLKKLKIKVDGSDHPPADLRRAFTRLAMLRCGAINSEEYSSPRAFDELWRSATIDLFNREAPRIRDQLTNEKH